MEIVDRYLTGTRLRLREVRSEDGSLVAEIDDGDQPSHGVPQWLDVVKDVSEDEAWTGVGLAR